MKQHLRKTVLCTNRVITLDDLDILIERCSSLHKLLRIISYLMRWRLKSTKPGIPKVLVGSQGHVRPVTAMEKHDALAIIVAWEQRKHLSLKQTEKLAPKTITKKLIYHTGEVSHTVVGGRVKNFPLAFTGQTEDIPILPDGGLAKLIVKHYHYRFHQEVDTVVTHIRNDFWILRCRKLASREDSKCKDCKIKRNLRASQIMGELPKFRTNIQPAFSTVGCDLWGPILIRDDVIKRGNRVTKKVWGVLFTCAATRAVYLDVACGSST